MTAWREQPTLVGDTVILRPMVDDDRDAILAAAEDGRAWELFHTNAPGPDSIDLWMAKAMGEQEHGRAMPFVVLQAGGTPTGTVVGTTRFMRMSEHNRRLEIGGTFYKQTLRRTGLNTAAKRLLLGYAFETLDCVCVQLRTDHFNRASQRAIERIGAKRDGVLRNHIIMRDGRIRDTVVYSIIANEWPGVRMNLDCLMALQKVPA